MSKTELADLEALLGHAIDPKGAESIRDLNDIPPDILSDAIRLDSTILRFRFLRFYTSRELWRWLPEFIEDVVSRRGDPRSWRRGGILFPQFAVNELIVLTVAEVLAVLHPVKDEAWRQFHPDRALWDRGEEFPGACAVVRPDMRYDWGPREHVWHMTIDSVADLRSVDDIAVATRRWIASRVTRAALRFSGIDRFDTPEALFDRAFQGVRNPSTDARVAVGGAIREAQILGPSDAEVPGFRGPSAWYQ